MMSASTKEVLVQPSWVGYGAAFTLSLGNAFLAVISAVLKERGVPVLQCSLALSAGSLLAFVAHVTFAPNGVKTFAEVWERLLMRNDFGLSDWLWFVASGCVCELCTYLVMAAAYYIPSGDAMTISTAMCMLCAPFGVWFAIGDGPPHGYWPSAVLCVAGVTLVSRPSFLFGMQPIEPLGILLASLSATFVIKEVGIQHLATVRNINSSVLTQSRLLIGGIVMLLSFVVCLMALPLDAVWRNPLSLDLWTLYLWCSIAAIYSVIPHCGTVMTVALGANVCTILCNSKVPFTVALEMLAISNEEPAVAYFGMAVVFGHTINSHIATVA